MNQASHTSPKVPVLLLSIAAVLAVGANTLGDFSFYNDRQLWGSSIWEFSRQFKVAMYCHVVLLILCAVLTMHAGWTGRERPTRYTPHWLFLAAIFVGLAALKGTSLHGTLVEFVRSSDARIGIPATAPAIAMACIGLLARPYWKFLHALGGRLRRGLIIAGLVYFIGAIGLEAVSEYAWTFGGPGALPYVGISVIEELLEAAGCIIAIHFLSDATPDEPSTHPKPQLQSPAGGRVE